MEDVPRIETIRGLLENSGNQCAFPGCSHPVLNHRNQFIAKLSYLDTRPVKGIDRNRCENIMFLCYRHHVETQDSISYPLEILQSIKANHESSALVENNSRFRLNTITTIQDSVQDLDSEEEQRELLDAAVTTNESITIPPLSSFAKKVEEENTNTDNLEDEDAIAYFEEESSKAIDELAESFEQESGDFDIIRVPGNIPSFRRSDVKDQPSKIGRITFKNSDSKRIQLQLKQLKTQVKELFGMLDTLKKSDNELNKELKTMVASLDILGIFHHRFSKLPFKRNPFINRNHQKVHARIPKLRNAVDGLIRTMENIAGGKEEAAVQNIKEEEVPQDDRSTTRILIKSIRYADQIAN